MFCPNCGKEINLNDVFCEHCGFALKSDKKKVNSNDNKKNNEKKLKTIFLLLIIIFVVVIVAWTCIQFMADKSSSEQIDILYKDNQNSIEDSSAGNMDNFSNAEAIEDKVLLGQMRGIFHEESLEESPINYMENYIIWLSLGDADHMYNMLSLLETQEADETIKNSYVQRLRNMSAFGVVGDGMVSVDYESLITFSQKEFIDYLESDGNSIVDFQKYFNYNSFYLFSGITFIEIKDEDVVGSYSYSSPLVVGFKDNKYSVVGELLWW